MTPSHPRPPRARALLVVGALVAAVLPALVSVPVRAVVPATPAFNSPEVDAPPQYDGQTLCSPAAKPGTIKLAKLLVATYGAASIGMPRACASGGQSEHKDGRALDWMQSVRVPSQRAKVSAFLSWLLRNDKLGNPAAMARRLGVMYIGWNNMIWRAYGSTPGWGDLKGCSTDPAKKAAAYDTTCHRNHVHISLSWDGAAGLTSFWTGTPLARSCEAPWGAVTTLAGAGGEVVPVEPVRALDTRRGTGLESPCRLGAPSSWNPGGSDVVVPVTGIGAVPTEGVAAVEVRVTAYRTSGITPTVLVRSTGTSPSQSVVSVLSATSYSGTALVPIASDGTIRLWVDRGGADLLVDVTGYVPLTVVDPTTPAAAAPVGGTSHTTRPVVVYDGYAKPLGPQETRTVHLAGVAPLPEAGLTGVSLTLTSRPTAAATVVSVLPASLRAYVGSLRTSTALTRSTQVRATVTNGDVVLRNLGRSPSAVRLVLNGWTTDTPAIDGAPMTTPPTAWRAVDSARRIGLAGPVTSAASRIVTLTDGTHVPAGATGVLVAVSALGGRTDGTLVIGSRSPISAVSFTAGRWSHEVVLLPLNPMGTLAVRTTSLGAQVRITVLAYLT